MRFWKPIRFTPILAVLTALLIMAGLLLFTADAAYAGYKANNAVDAWDEVQNKYQHSLVVVTFNGGWVPFFHEMSNFDANIYPDDYLAQLPPAAPLDACYGTGVHTYTQYAGIMQFGLYHTDNDPVGAPGFQRSYEWQIVKCDRTGDGVFNNDDLNLAPGTANMVPFPSAIFQVLYIDQVVACTSGNCQDEIVTTMFVNFDTNCDGDLSDEGIPPGGLCFYALAQTPTTMTWKGNPQGRVSAGGGEQTVNFNPRTGPLAVTLSSFVGNSPTAGFGALLLALGCGGATLLFWRARRRG